MIKLVIVKGRFARQGETVSSRPKFVSLAFDTGRTCMMIVRYNSMEEKMRFVTLIKLFCDTCSGLSAVG